MKRSIFGMAIAAALGFGGFLWLNQPDRSLPANPLANGSSFGAAIAQDAEDLDISTIVEMQMGNPDAPVTVVEYASYTCPHCKNFHVNAFKDLKANYIDTGKINFIYREVYFDRFGLWASAIARCAGPEKFFGITDLIYAGQDEWIRAGGGEPAAIVDELRKIGRIAGIEAEAIEACLQDGTKLKTLVAWFQENAKQDDINSTPSFVINGTKHGNMNFSEMAAIIDDASS